MHSQLHATPDRARGTARWVVGALALLAALLARPVLPSLHAHQHSGGHAAHVHHSDRAHAAPHHEHRDHDDQASHTHPDDPAPDPGHTSACPICDDLFRAKSVVVTGCLILAQTGRAREFCPSPPIVPVLATPDVGRAGPRGPPAMSAA